MSKLADAIATHNQTRKGPACSVGQLKLPADAARDLAAAFADEGVKHTAIVRALKAEFGIDIASGSLARHRKGECGCAR